MSPGVALSWYQLGIGHGYSPGARKVSEVYWGARRKTTGRRRDTAYLGNESRRGVPPDGLFGWGYGSEKLAGLPSGCYASCGVPWGQGGRSSGGCPGGRTCKLQRRRCTQPACQDGRNPLTELVARKYISLDLDSQNGHLFINCHSPQGDAGCGEASFLCTGEAVSESNAVHPIHLLPDFGFLGDTRYLTPQIMKTPESTIAHWLPVQRSSMSSSQPS